MHDRTLLRGALFLSLIGILLLYFLQQTLLPPLETINDWNQQDMGKLVRTRGVIQRVSVQNNKTYITLNQTCFLTVILPKPNLLPSGIEIEVTGKYNEYTGKKEIQADTIRTS